MFAKISIFEFLLDESSLWRFVVVGNRPGSGECLKFLLDPQVLTIVSLPYIVWLDEDNHRPLQILPFYFILNSWCSKLLHRMPRCWPIYYLCCSILLCRKHSQKIPPKIITTIQKNRHRPPREWRTVFLLAICLLTSSDSGFLVPVERSSRDQKKAYDFNLGKKVVKVFTEKPECHWRIFPRLKSYAYF